MRVTGGKLRGRRLVAPKGTIARPTSDRVREGVCSALEARHAIDKSNVLDLFAGTGALSIEVLSRGASHATLVENNTTMLRTIEKNLTTLNLKDRSQTLSLNLLGSPEKSLQRLEAQCSDPFTLVFADPPYAVFDAVIPLIELLVNSPIVSNDAYVLLECPSSWTGPMPPPLEKERTFRYGSTSVVLARTALS